MLFKYAALKCFFEITYYFWRRLLRPFSKFPPLMGQSFPVYCPSLKDAVEMQ